MNFLKSLSLGFTILLTSFSFAQTGTVRGFVYEKSTGEPILYQKVKLVSASNTIYGAVTDLNGFFSIPKLALGTYTLKIDDPAYKKVNLPVNIQKASEIVDLKIELEKSEAVKELGEVNVTAEQKQKTNEVGMSQIKLDKKGLERIPSVGAENDVVGAFSVTPGVVTTGDQGGQLYVRGGTPIQNKILLDGMTIYTPFHSIGFFSIFETELVKNVDIYTGGFDAKYGGRISSVMDITYRDGNRKEFGGKVSVSPFLAKLVLEGPFSKGKDGKPSNASYVFSAKHSLLDYTSKNIYPRVNEGNGLPFAFTDIYGKVTLNANGGSKFSFFGFNNTDRVQYNQLADLEWSQSGGGMNFLLIPAGSPVFIRGHFNLSNYSLKFLEQGSPERNSSIGGADLGFDFTFFQKNEGQLDLGININGFETNYLTYNEASTKIEDYNFTFEVGTYINYKVIKNRWVFQPGLRLQTYASLGVLSPEPRIGAKYNINEKMRLKLSGGRYSQNFTSASSDRDVVNLFNGLLSAPSNFQSNFVQQNGNVRPVKNALQYSWHGIIGYEVDLNKQWSANVEGYIKYFDQLSNINQNKLYEDVSQFSDIDDVFKKDFIIESGRSYGVDVLLKYAKDRLFIWGVYSYGNSTRWDGFIQYSPVFDRRHNMNLVTSYMFGKKKDLELNIRWNFGSGLPFTPTAGSYQTENFSNGVTTDYTSTNTDNVSILLGDFNSRRLPTYHRLDVTIKKNFEFKNKTNLELVASVTNAYNRNNIFYVNRVTNQKIYQFPILPSFGMSYKF
jgi:hypothetical protein